MLFPELRAWFKGLFPDDGRTLSLDLKNISFSSRDVPDAKWLIENGYYQIAAALGSGFPAWSGESVTLSTALSHSVVWACNRIISETVGFLPANLMQKTSGGMREADNLPMYAAMKYAPNSDISSQGFREMLTSHCVMGGDAYAKIIRRSGSGTALALEPLLPEQVRPSREKAGAKRLKYELLNENGQVEKTYFVEPSKPHDILHLRGLGYDGIRGYSVITVGKNSIGSAIAAEKNLARFWANGGRVPFHLENPGKFKTRDDGEQFAKDFRESYSDPHKAPITENGIKLVQDGMSMRDSQGIENRQFTVSEICRWFSVSPHLVADLSRATFSNIEHLSLEFVKQTLSPWLVRWESDFWRCVLTPAEQEQGYYLKHNVNALLRGDFKTRMDGYASALQNGHMVIDEVRELEDRDPLPSGAGSHSHIQSNMGVVMRDGQVQTPQPIQRNQD